MSLSKTNRQVTVMVLHPEALIPTEMLDEEEPEEFNKVSSAEADNSLKTVKRFIRSRSSFTGHDLNKLHVSKTLFRLFGMLQNNRLPYMTCSRKPPSCVKGLKDLIL